jgi:hypothetical protein
MVIECDGKVIAQKTFSLLVEHGNGEMQLGKKEVIRFVLWPSLWKNGD